MTRRLGWRSAMLAVSLGLASCGGDTARESVPVAPFGGFPPGLTSGLPTEAAPPARQTAPASTPWPAPTPPAPPRGAATPFPEPLLLAPDSARMGAGRRDGGVYLGYFLLEEDARSFLVRQWGLYPRRLGPSTPWVAEGPDENGNIVHHVYGLDMSRDHAIDTCRRLMANGETCSVVAP